MQFQEFPFKIVALAPFNMDAGVVWDHPPLTVDRHSIDEAMSAMQINHYLALDADLCASGGITLRFDRLKSLHPDGIAGTHPFFKQLARAGRYIEESRRQGRSAAEIAQGLQQWPDLPALKIKSATPKKRADRQASSVENILDMVAVPGDEVDTKPVYKDESDQIAALQQNVLSRLFDLPEFRKMEAAWRGLRLLLQQGIPNDSVKVEIVPTHGKTLTATLDALTPALIEKPPGMVLLDLAFDNTPLAMERLADAARWAATLMVPVVAWCPAPFFQIATWDELNTLPFIPNHIQGPAYAKYQALKTSDDGRWCCLTCNRFLIRYPYGKENRPRQVAFTEKQPLWISPAWALGTLASQSTDRTGWPTRFTDRHQCCIQDLALTSRPDTPPMVVEALLSRDRTDQMIRAGITPLATQTGTDKAFVTRAVTLSDTPLAYQLLTGRVTSFLLWCKDNLPEATSPPALETQLRLAFQVFSEQSRPSGFETIEISAGTRNAEGGIPLRLALKPAAAILPSQQMIEMGLDW